MFLAMGLTTYVPKTFVQDYCILHLSLKTALNRIIQPTTYTNNDKNFQYSHKVVLYQNEEHHDEHR